MFTKPRGMHANFRVDCPRCDGEFTVTNGRIEWHECRERPITLLEIRRALDARELEKLQH